MASSAVALCAALLLLLLASSSLGGGGVRAEAQSGMSSSCTADLVRLLPCLPYFDGAASGPSDTCCTNLGSMAHDEPQCLCQALSQPGASPVSVNMSRVLEMPRLCRLDIPSPTDACRGFLPQGPALPPPAVSALRPNATSTAPSTLSPATPTRPRMATSPLTGSPTPGYSRGTKATVDRLSVALGFVALVSVQALF